MELIDRLVIESHEEGDCWLWDGAKLKAGYGCITWQGRTWLVHRLAFDHFHGDCPPELHHECGNKACFNPEHLVPISHSENVRLGFSHNRVKTHCPQGHAYTPENTTVNRGKRYCRTCKREDAQKRRLIAATN